LYARVALAVSLLAALDGGCGGSGCPFGVIARLDLEVTVGCCGGSAWQDVGPRTGSDLDLAVHKAEGPAAPLHAWLTTPDCVRLFDGDYPPASGSPVPLCTAYIGPVSPGEVSPRRKLSPGNYRVWVQAFSSSPEPRKVLLDVGIWGEQCDRPPL
jgi:hypothetical protein